MRAYESLESRTLLCAGDVAIVPPVSETDEAVEEPIEVAPDTFVIERGTRRHIVYAKLDGTGLTEPGVSSVITGTLDPTNPDDFSQVIPRAAGQRRMELAVGVSPSITVRSTPDWWRPDPTSHVAPTLQASEFLDEWSGPGTWRGDSSGVQAIWELHSANSRDRALDAFFPGNEYQDILEGRASIVRNRVIYATV